MLIKRIHGWEVPERGATSESAYLNRRGLVTALGLGAIAASIPSLARAEDDPSARLYPARPTPPTARRRR